MPNTIEWIRGMLESPVFKDVPTPRITENNGVIVILWEWGAGCLVSIVSKSNGNALWRWRCGGTEKEVSRKIDLLDCNMWIYVAKFLNVHAVDSNEKPCPNCCSHSHGTIDDCVFAKCVSSI